MGVEMEAICLACWHYGRNILGFETTPGFRLSREFETSQFHDLYPLGTIAYKTTQTDAIFILCGWA
jgi:hypothetical protein